MTKEIGIGDRSEISSYAGVKRRGLLRLGTLLTAMTGASAVPAISAAKAQAAPEDAAAQTYIPVTEKASPSGVATLDANAQILPAQIPDLSANFVSALTPLGAAVARSSYAPRIAETYESSIGLVKIPSGATKENGMLLRPFEPDTRTSRFVNTGNNSFVVAYSSGNRHDFFQPDVPYPVGNLVPPGSEWVETRENRPLWVISALGTTIAYEVQIGA